jgi:hypothetical protein
VLGAHHRDHLPIDVHVLHWLLVHILLRNELLLCLELLRIKLSRLLLRLLSDFLALLLVLAISFFLIKYCPDIPCGHPLEVWYLDIL